ncbi:hypothetical protein [Tautonia plasticadhaerens]|uniref:Peptidase MA-like domain-containing protein n=1 Tax=Tautonia plasticadhaerens TaxID=2527974 RepID=A0A518HBJ8_9BACT|nr:hypothetical protein [Tautonia plasticadhaerens]QDV38232.1 hypothetical protein ElP_61830 [Tautonia plasticadhaerens]
MDMRWRRLAASPALFVLLVAPTLGRQEPLPPAEALVLDDFEEPGLGGRWEAFGELKASRVPVPEGSGGVEGVSGTALLVDGGPGASLRTRPIPDGPDLSRFDRAVVRVNARGASAEDPVVFEVHFYAAGRRAWRWRKVSLDRDGWQELRLPLAYFRPGGGTSPSWDEVDRLGFHLRTDAELVLDGLELVPGDSEDAAELSVDQLLRDAFGPEAETRVHRRGPFVVLTDSPDVPEAPLLDALEAMGRRTREEFPNLPEPTGPVWLLIFAEDDDYRAFWPRFARRFAGEMGPPGSGGFTALGIASASCLPDDPEAVRPVFVHEASHALMDRMLGVASEGNWLFEALGTRYQLDVSGQDLGPIVRQGLADPKARSPLEELLDGEPVPETRYWQVATVVDWLLDDPGRRAAFHLAVDAMRSRGSTDLRPLAPEFLGGDLDELEPEWLDWLRRSYGDDTP